MSTCTLTCVLCVGCRPTLQIPDMLGVVLSSSKYGVRQARGKYGMGAKMALIWSKKSTGLPIQVCACVPRVVGRLDVRQAALASIKLGPTSASALLLFVPPCGIIRTAIRLLSSPHGHGRIGHAS